METSRINIYPLNEENLKALLNYYFPFLPGGNVKRLLTELKGLALTLKELEYASEKILPFISLIGERIGKNPTQTNILDYSVEIFLDPDINYSDRSPDRIEIIKAIRTRAGFDELYEDMHGKETRLFIVKNWN
jgi:hypothetical protein